MIRAISLYFARCDQCEEVFTGGALTPKAFDTEQECEDAIFDDDWTSGDNGEYSCNQCNEDPRIDDRGNEP